MRITREDSNNEKVEHVLIYIIGAQGDPLIEASIHEDPAKFLLQRTSF